MKKAKIIIMAVALLALPVVGAFSQMVVADPMLLSLVTESHAENLLQFAQMITAQVENAKSTYDQFQNMLRMEQLAMDNLKSFGKFKNIDDFKNWYNRQLYLENNATNKFLASKVKVGNSYYNLQDITDVPDAMYNQFDPHQITQDLSEAERKQMWLKLGLSPANYAHRQVWKERGDKLATIALTKRELNNEENAALNKELEDLSTEYDKDKTTSENSKLTEKQIQMDQTRLAIEQLKMQQKIQEELAIANEMNAVNMQKNKDVKEPLRLSETYKTNIFNDTLAGTSITEDDL